MKNNVIRVSDDTKKTLEEFKRKSKKSTYEEVILFLLSEKKEDINSVVEIEAQKKILESLQDKIDQRVESVQKRLSKFADLYFKRIIDNYNFSQRALVELSEKIYLAAENNNSDTETVQNIVNEVIRPAEKNDDSELEELRNQTEKDFIKIRDLSDTLRGLKYKFEEKRSGFTKVYEARLSVDDYQKIFE